MTKHSHDDAVANDMRAATEHILNAEPMPPRAPLWPRTLVDTLRTLGWSYEVPQPPDSAAGRHLALGCVWVLEPDGTRHLCTAHETWALLRTRGLIT